MRAIDETGKRYGRLMVRGRHGARGGAATWVCLCDCGTCRIVAGSSLRSGNTASCGCATRESASRRFRTHGKSKSLVYGVWNQMIQRCYNRKHISFPRYGAIGITVCDWWRDSFENFQADMGQRPPGKAAIDRIDNARGYSPENCRWVTYQENARNRRSNRILTCQGVGKPLAQWCDELGLGPKEYGTIWMRLKRGWSDAEAIGEFMTQEV